MTITDDRAASPAPPTRPPSYVRRHPILAGFGVLSGLSLFAALWPVSAIVVAVAVGGHATGLDGAAWSAMRKVAARVERAVRHDVPTSGGVPSPTPVPPAEPVPHPPHSAAAVAPRQQGARAPSARARVRPHRANAPDRRVGAGIEGPEA